MIHHNWAYNSELKGTRFDTCGGKKNTGYPECGSAIWNNVFFNTHQGANVKGDYQLVVGNTAFANGQRVDISIPVEGVGGTEDDYKYNKFTKVYNNAAQILSRHDGRCELPLPGADRDGNFVPGCQSGNAHGTTPIKQLLRDPFNLDFRPRNVRYPDGLVAGGSSRIPKFETLTGDKLVLEQGNDVG